MFLLRLFLWIIPHLLLLFCILGLFRDARYRKFPVFFIYLLLEEAQFIFSFTVYLFIPYFSGAFGIFQWTVVVIVAISACLELAVLYEVAGNLVLSSSPIFGAIRPLMRWAVAFFVMLAVGVSAIFSESGVHRVIHTFEVLNFATSLVNLGLLLVLLLFSRAFHISWKSLPAGIVLGFGIDSSAEMGATSLISALGNHGVLSADIVRMLAFIGCTLVWLIYVFLSETRPQFTGQGLQASEMKVWDQELRRMAPR